ncbi:MAG: hypothetical protein ABI721_01640 [Candidatus Dojkabacteria bacterium]
MKRKIFLVIVILFLCVVALLSSIGALLLFRQNQLTTNELINQNNKVDELQKQINNNAAGGTFLEGSGATGSDTPGVPPVDAGDSTTAITKIYFSKTPQSYDSDFSYVVGVDREVNKSESVVQAIEKILAGPTAAETALGYKNPITLTGSSNCGGNLFTFSSNYDSMATANDVTIKFCKDVTISGIGDSGRIQAVIKKTLQGLEHTADYKVGKIAILDKNGNCLGDESGMNACLN